MINYQQDLNKQQFEVVKNSSGACLVLAGAGSGKTRTITYRVAYLLEQGVDHNNILLLTFTNKAANEMIARIKKLTGMEYKLPYAGTFHSIANKILRIKAKLLGYANNFTILDSDDSLSLIKIALKQFKPDTDKRFPSARVLQSIISYARNAETNIENVLDLRYPQWLEFSENIKNIAEYYTKQKKQANAMDFDDLLVNWLLLLNKPEVQKKLSKQFQYILVDEYQDANKIQASIIRKLSLHYNNVLVVGDDAQSIYSFRAAEVKNILDFADNYPNATIFKLETNYRSSQEILDVANIVIANNLKQYKKELSTVIQTGIKPVLSSQADQQQEARFVVDKIKAKLEAGVLPQDIAVLFRAAYHSQLLEMELMKSGIDYDYRGGLRFFERAHIKDVLAYLRLLNNLVDFAAWLRVLLHEEGIGSVSAQKIIEQIRKVKNIEEVAEVGYNLLGERAKQGWQSFVSIWNKLLAIDKNDVTVLIMAIKESNYQDYLQAEYTDAKERLADIEQLATFSEQYDNLDNFLAEASLQEGFSQTGLLPHRRNKGKNIILSTIHQAKGLEWDTVFVINLASGAFPTDYAWKEADGIEEERRLFYVAVTRAKKHLYFTYPLETNNWNMSGPSIFLEEISSELLEDHSLSSNSSLVLDDDIEEVKYVSERIGENSKKRKGFLIDISEL